MEEKSDKNKENRINDLLRFYKSYFMEYWEVKYKYLKYEIENYDFQKQRLAEISGFDVISNYEKNFLSMLKFDLHFMKFQIIETLFSFIFALENGDDVNLWFNLSFPKDSSERSFAAYDKISVLNKKWEMEQYLRKEIIQDTDDSIQLWQYLFFLSIDLSQFDKNFDKIQENISTNLYQMASIFTDRDDYNAYKHSLRCYGSSLALSIRPQGTNQFIPIGYAKDGMNFLTIKEKDNNIIINYTFKAFSIEEDSYYINKAIELLKNILNTRISHFFSENVGEIYFFEEDVIPIFQEDYTIPSISRSTISRNSLYLTGLYILKQGEFEKSISFFEKVLQIDNSHYETIFQLGYCHFSMGNYDKAIYYHKRYIKNSVAELWNYALYNLALCYFKKNDYKNAEKKLKQYLSKYSDIEDQLTNSVRYLLTEILLDLKSLFDFFYNQLLFNFCKVSFLNLCDLQIDQCNMSIKFQDSIR